MLERDQARLFGDLKIAAEGLDAPAHIQRVLSIVRQHLGMDVGFVSEFTGGQRVPGGRCRWRMP